MGLFDGPEERSTRIPIQDEPGVLPLSKQGSSASKPELYSAISEATVADLICEGVPIIAPVRLKFFIRVSATTVFHIRSFNA